MSIYNPIVNGIYTVLQSLARTATVTVLGRQILDPTSQNTDARFQQGAIQEASGIIAYLNVSIASGSGGLSLVLEEQDPASGNWSQVAATLPNTGTGLIKLKIKSAIAAVAATTSAVQLQDILPPIWRIKVVHADASSYTYSLGVILYA